MAHFLFVFSSLLLFDAPTWSQQEHTSNFFPIKESAKAPASSKYTCKIDNECLNNLHNILLNKESERSIYQYCEAFYQNSRQCCISPSECNEDFGRETAQLLRQKSLSLAQNAGPSCQSNPKLSSFLWQAQSLMCQKGVSHCRQRCKDKLGELKRTFKQCFLIPASYSIDTILDRARTPSSHPHCWKEMRDVAKKYKEQSRNSQAVFKEYLKVRDIVDCESIIKQSVSRQNSNHFAFNICNQVQAQKQEPAKPEERKEPIRKQETKEPTKPMGHWPAYDAEEWEEQQEKIRQSHAAVFGYRIEKTQEPESSLSPEHNKEIQSEKWGVVKEEKYGIVKDEPSLETGLDMSPGSLVREVPDKPEEDNKSLSDTLSKSDKDISKNDKEENKDKSSQAGKTPKKPSDKALAKVPKKKSSVSKTKNSPPAKSSLSQRPTKQKNPSVFVNKDRTQKTASQVNKAKAKKTNSKRRKADSRTKQSKDLKKKQASKQDPSHASLAGSELKPSSNSKPLQVAQVSNRSRRCPVSMPKIKSAVVFQSVQAPQTKPMNEQEFQKDPDDPDFKSYDLVMKKLAGVLVHLDGTKMDRNRKFAMDLFISGDDKYINKCFHTPFAGEMIRRRDSFCSFTHSPQIFKFFPLPMRSEILSREIKNLPIKLTLYPRGYENNKKCHQEKIFKIKIIKTNHLKLGFTQIYGGKNCTGYDSASYETVKAFARSREVKDKLEKMFPLTRVSSRILRSFMGNCDDTFVREWLNSYEYINQYTAGLLSDTLALERARKLKKYHKLFAIVPQDYFFFHKRDDPADPEDDFFGLVIRPIWKECRLLWIFPIRKCKLLGGSHNVVFIREDAVDTGSVAHELSHTLGQGKEHYKGYYDKKKQHPVLCQRFRGSPLKPCEDYEIPIALEAGWDKDKKRSYWKFIGNRKSIMNDNENIDDQWIDRETHQIIFKTLAEGPIIVPDSVDAPSYKKHREPSSSSFQSKKEQPSLKVIVSGFYYKKRESFVVPSQKIYKTDWLSPSLSKTKNKKIPPVTFQLREKNKILQEVRRPVFKMEAELFYKNKAPKPLPFEFSLLMAALNLPGNSPNRQLRIVVLSPKGNVIYSVPVRIKQKSKTENVALIDNIQQGEG